LIVLINGMVAGLSVWQKKIMRNFILPDEKI